MKIEVEYYGEELAQSIKNVDAAVTKLAQAGVTQRLLVTLIKDMNPTLRKDDITYVLNSLSRIKSTYLRDVKE